MALYDYRDLDDPYREVEHCNFETCTLEVFEDELAKIEVSGGGDTPESLLSASWHAMKALKWKYGSTKSLVVLTDANFLSPDRDGMTFDEVVALSKTIDPVNFYIITKPFNEYYYGDLAAATDGKVVTNFDELSLLTDYIMERYDSLPRVEENEVMERPILEIDSVQQSGETEMTVEFTTNGVRTMVILNDAVLGVTDDALVTLSGLDAGVENVLTLVPLGDDIRGEGVSVILEMKNSGTVFVPKAPDTGKV